MLAVRGLVLERDANASAMKDRVSMIVTSRTIKEVELLKLIASDGDLFQNQESIATNKRETLGQWIAKTKFDLPNECSTIGRVISSLTKGAVKDAFLAGIIAVNAGLRRPS